MNKQGAHIQALGGHLVDLYRMATFKYANPYSYTKFRNINGVRKASGARMMIETGTYLGVTTARCARVFEKVYTIELDSVLAAQAAEYLRPRGNVEVIQGDCLKVLPTILQRPEVSDVLIFLDGHFSGGGTAKGDMAEPAVEEIDVLAQYRDKIRAVVIDDFRCFGAEEGWPSKSALLRAIETHFPRGYNLTIHLDQVLLWRVNGR